MYTCLHMYTYMYLPSELRVAWSSVALQYMGFLISIINFILMKLFECSGGSTENVATFSVFQMSNETPLTFSRQ